MNSIQWEKIKKVFSEALEIPPAGREKFLKEKFDDNLSQNEVLSLLKSFDTADSFLENKVSTFIKEADDNDPLIGTHTGIYKIIAPIAQGGMGTVYLGIRDDEQFKMKAAIKLIRLGLNSEHIIKRFENERQTLAGLNHSNIAKLLDGGKTKDGIPYFVMEYIEGKPIDDYCFDKKLDISERLDLFRTVCSAVHYAHQNLIVHRDIKPGNILVTTEGIPKLLDFGIAKILEDTANVIHTDVTQVGFVQFTPEYASPEQIKNEAITTVSDIYSLGILLYKILTGFHPYKMNNLSRYEIDKVITNEEPEKPSTALLKSTSGSKETENVDKYAARKTGKILKGDLDNIILMAIRKEPQRRYSSVQQFSDDIKRYLNGLPVTAAKDSLHYRASKFIKRHKAGVTAAVIINIFIFIAIAGIIWQANIASVERDKAQTEAKKSNQVKLFVQNMLSAVDPNQSGREVKVYDVLNEASTKIETELKEQPELKAEIHSTIGITYQNLGIYDEGIPHLLSALELKEQLYSKNSLEYASALKDLALLYHYKADFAVADSVYLLSILIFRKEKKNPTIEFAQVLNNYGNLLCDEGRFDESEKYLREALSVVKNLKESDDDVIGSAINNLAITLDYKGEFDEAEKLYREAYNFFYKKFGEVHPRIATATNNLAFVQWSKKNFKEAERLFRKAYEMKLKIYGIDHPDVGLAAHNWGCAFYYLKNYDEAENKLNDALANYKGSLSNDHFWYARTLHWLGKVYNAKGDLNKAETNLRSALSLRKKVHTPSHYEISVTESELGYCLALKRNYSEAEKLLLQSYNSLINSLGNKSEYTITAKKYLIETYKLWGRNEKAKELLTTGF